MKENTFPAKNENNSRQSKLLQKPDHRLFPRVKPTIQIITRESGKIYVGNSVEGFEFDAMPYLQLLHLCTGLHDTRQIEFRLNLTQLELQYFLGQLNELGLIELLSEPIKKSSGAINIHDQSINFLQEIEVIERALITHRSDDGGEEEFESRAKFKIAINGDTRISRTLLPLLCASGFTQTEISQSYSHSSRIEIRDINALSVSIEDIGKNKEIHHQELIRRSKFFSQIIRKKDQPESPQGREKHITGACDLIISTSPPQVEDIQMWQSEGRPHIAVGNLIGYELEISPLIIPGLTPCLRCISLHKRDALPKDLQPLSYSHFLTSGRTEELPVASAALIASYLAAKVSGISLVLTKGSRSDQSDLSVSSHVINLLDPFAGPQLRRWSLHPECGCVDVQRRVLPR